MLLLAAREPNIIPGFGEAIFLLLLAVATFFMVVLSATFCLAGVRRARKRRAAGARSVVAVVLATLWMVFVGVWLPAAAFVAWMVHDTMRGWSSPPSLAAKLTWGLPIGAGNLAVLVLALVWLAAARRANRVIA